MCKPSRLIAALFSLFFIFGCSESEQQKWVNKSDWNFMVNTCSLNGGTETIASCDESLAQQAAETAANYSSLYQFIGPSNITMQMYVSPNSPYYNQMNIEKITRIHTAPLSFIKGKEPNTLSIVLHTNGCDVTTNYRLAELGKVYEQTISAVGSSCGEDQRAVAEYGLKDGPKLQFLTRN